MGEQERTVDMTMSLLTFELERGQEALYVDVERQVRSWRAPYCGPTRLHVPTFEATREELQRLEEELAAKCPAGTSLSVHPRGEEDPATGVRAYGLWAAVNRSP